MLPILTYHSIGRLNPILDTPVENFESQLQAFADLGYKTITVSSLVQMINNKQPLPEKTFALTFDDGYKTFFSDAWPVLRKFDFDATVYLITDFCGKDNRWVGQPDSVPTAPLLSWQEVTELAKEGCQFGGHTVSHRPLSTLSGDAMADELARCKERISEATGQNEMTFAYPYGDTTHGAVASVQKYYQGAVSTNLGLCDLSSDCYLLPRIDSFYLTREWINNLDKSWFRPYLGLRQALRRVKRVFQPDWQPHEYKNVG